MNIWQKKHQPAPKSDQNKNFIISSILFDYIIKIIVDNCDMSIMVRADDGGLVVGALGT